MLVRFHSRASGSVTMFGDIAAELLRHMGMSGMVPGAVLAQDVPEALRRLRQVIESSEGDRVPQPLRPKSEDQGKENEEEAEQEVAKINLRTRAYPLIHLLETAAAEDCAVVWEDSSKATG